MAKITIVGGIKKDSAENIVRLFKVIGSVFAQGHQVIIEDTEAPGVILKLIEENERLKNENQSLRQMIEGMPY